MNLFRLLLASIIALAPQLAMAEPVKLMTWNPEFLWDGAAPEEGSSKVRFPWRGDATDATARMDRMARVVGAAAPDVVVLQEVENAAALQALASRLPGYVPHFVQGRDTFTGQDVAVLSRLPLERVDRFDEADPLSGKRVSKNLVVLTSISGRPIAIVGLHLLSRASDPGRRQDREQQARATVAALGKLSGRAVIVMGDLNDYDHTVEHRSRELVPVTDVLAMIKGRGTEDQADDLVNAFAGFQAGQPLEERWTSHWDRDGDDAFSGADAFTVIDHILVDPGLKLISAGIVRHPDAAVSDHRPVMAVIDVEPAGTH